MAVVQTNEMGAATVRVALVDRECADLWMD